MSITALDPILMGSLPMAPIAPTTPAATTSFESVLNGLQDLNAQAVADEQATAGLALGQMDNLHQVMIDMERTRLGFEMMLAVRTKVLDAYQELMRMQV
jgi:flagellar hook-basal body complex protein FliE